MSKDQATEFLKKVSADKTTAERFQEAFRATLVQAGKDAGFSSPGKTWMPRWPR